MSEQEKKILEAIIKAIPTLDDFTKGYLSGYLAGKGEVRNSAKEDNGDDKKEGK